MVKKRKLQRGDTGNLVTAVPPSTTSETGTSTSSAMKPRMEKITTPANIEVPELIKAISTASLWQLLSLLL